MQDGSALGELAHADRKYLSLGIERARRAVSERDCLGGLGTDGIAGG